MRLIVALALGLGLAACAGGNPGGGGDDDGDGDGGAGRPDSGGGDGDDDGGPPIDFTNNQIASPAPPGNLEPSDAPQIIVFGWDDIAFTGDHQGDAGETDNGMNFLIKAFGSITNPDGSKGAITFYQNAAYLPNTEPGGPWGSETNLMLAAGRDLVAKGFEVGSHTFDHLEINATWGKIPTQWKTGSLGGWAESIGTKLDEASWTNPIISTNDQILVSSYNPPGGKLYGFRAPRLEMNDAGLRALAAFGYEYETSMEEGQQWQYVTAATRSGADRAGFDWVVWPHTLDNGSPGAWQSRDFGEKDYLQNFPSGLWEIPVYMLYIPDNGLQQRIATRMKTEITTEDTTWITDRVREITAFDFNTFLYARMTKAEWVDVMKYNFLLRYNGNRAPLTFGAHPEEFSARYDREVLTQANNTDFLDVLNYNTYRDRKAAVLEFVQWVKANYPNDVYFMSGKQLVEYMKKPFDKTGAPVEADVLATPRVGNFVKRYPEWAVNKDTLGSDAVVTLDGNAMSIDFTIGKKNEPMMLYPFVDVATYFAAGTLTGVSHIDLVYETGAPIRVRLLTEETGPLSTQVLLSGGTGERKARLRIKDFAPDPYADPEKIADANHVDAEYLAKVIGLSFESASPKDQTSFEVKIKRIVVHGLGEQSLVTTRSKKLERGPRSQRPRDIRASSVFWPRHEETHTH